MDSKKHKNFDRIAKVGLKHIPSTELISTKDFHFVPIYFFHAHSLGALRNIENLAPRPHWVTPFSEREISQLIFDQQSIAGLNSSQEKIFGAFHRTTGQYLGEYSLHKNPLDHLQMEFKFHHLRDEVSSELSTRLLSQWIQYIFKKLNKKKVFTYLLSDHVTEWDFLRRLGFQLEAHYKENIRINEKWVDELFLGLLANDWHK